MLSEAKNIPSKKYNNSFIICVMKSLLLISDWTEACFFFRDSNPNARNPKALKELNVRY